MNFIDSIAPETTQTTQCPCGCPGRWIDTAGSPHCEACDPWPSPYLVTRRELLTGDSWQPAPYWGNRTNGDSSTGEDRGEATTDPPEKPYDPFHDPTPPRGTWHPVADRRIP